RRGRDSGRAGRLAHRSAATRDAENLRSCLTSWRIVRLYALQVKFFLTISNHGHHVFVVKSWPDHDRQKLSLSSLCGTSELFGTRQDVYGPALATFPKKGLQGKLSLSASRGKSRELPIELARKKLFLGKLGSQRL